MERILCLHAAAKRLQIPERTLRYQAAKGRIQGAFKQGKLWKFAMPPQGAPRGPQDVFARGNMEGR